MFYCYAVTQAQTDYGDVTSDFVVSAGSRIDVMKYLKSGENVLILNLIELTEEEYREMKQYFDDKKELNK